MPRRLKRELVDGLDIVIVRELTGGLYFGEPKADHRSRQWPEARHRYAVYDTYEIERIGRVAFELARKRRNKVTSCEKHNVMKSGVLWRDIDHRRCTSANSPTSSSSISWRTPAACSSCAGRSSST